MEIDGIVNDKENVDTIKIIDVEDDEYTKNQSKLSEMETIVIEDEQNNSNEYCGIKCKIKLACNELSMDPLLAKFIKRCLKIEDSDAMLNVLNLLLKIYERVDPDYKKSNKFNRLLNRGNKYLKVNPLRKFAHIKMIVDSLKIYDSSNRTERKNETKHEKEKQPKISVNFDETSDVIEIKDVVDLNTECVEDTVSNPNKDNSKQSIRTRIMFEDAEFVLHETKNRDRLYKSNHNKSDLNSAMNLIDSDSDDIEIFDEIKTLHSFKGQMHEDCSNNNKKAEINESSGISKKNKAIISDNLKENNDTNLLVPLKWDKVNNEMTLKEKIKQIERDIAVCKKKIAHYEIKEVCDDTVNSPYLITLKLKAKVVRLYQTLCTLIGESPVKRRKIRLRVAEGLPSGPTMRLEEFFNNNIRADGHPPFPDFNDVLSCVKKSNIDDNLGWSKEKIVAEAQGLFEQCGRVLKQRRQNREWRDVISLVNKDDLDDDPAEKNPELLAKLKANKKIAIAKENDVFERYTKLQISLAAVTMDIEESDSENDKSDTSFQFEDDHTKVEDMGLPVKRIKLERIDHSTIFDSSLVIEVSDSSDSDSSISSI